MLRSFAVGVIILALIGGFMALDRTVGHWYVPEAPEVPTTDDVAREFLGDWDRSVPLEAPELTGRVDEPPPGPAAQLRYALGRLAWVEAIGRLGTDVRGLSDQAKANRFQQCAAFLLGRDSNFRSCNLVVLGE